MNSNLLLNSIIPAPAYPAVLLEELVSLVAAREAAALDGLAEKLLGERQKRRDEEEDGGPPACHEEVNVTVGLR